MEVMKIVSSQPFLVGDRVRHARFGSGTVQSVDGGLVLVMFDGRVGQKKVAASSLDKVA
jgi:hypothetical protein